MKLSFPPLLFAGLALTMVGALPFQHPIQEACPAHFRRLDEREGFHQHHLRGLQALTTIVGTTVVRLGVHDEGHLNIFVADGTGGVNTPDLIGLQFFRDGGWYEGTAPGCLCEGFGVSARLLSSTMSFSGYANEDAGTAGLTPLASGISSDGVSATTVATTNGGPLQVTHLYEPSPDTVDLYKVTVTFKNLDATETLTDLRYRRVMDWDIPPTEFRECVSIDAGTSKDLEFASDDGFASSDPLSGYSARSFGCPTGAPCAVFDNGPSDHGALFQFLFKGDDGTTPLTIPPGESISFKIYYGAAPNKVAATNALAAVGAEVYSFGYPNVGGRCGEDLDGGPNVFIFGFSGVGGETIFNSPPNANCRNIEITTAARVTVGMINAGSTDIEDDLEGIPLICTMEPADPAGPFEVGTTTITLTCTDSDGASDSCVSTVTVVAPPPANIAPTVICRNIEITTADRVTPEIIDGGSTDPEDGEAGIPLTCTVDPAGPFEVGTYMITLTCTDSDGASGWCECAATVVAPPPANIAPTARCCDITITTADRVTPEMIDNGSTDPEDSEAGIPLTCTADPAGPFEVGTYMITLTCTDSDGASDSCVSTVTVEAPPPANIAPTAICLDIEITTADRVTPDMIDGGSTDPEDDGAGIPLTCTADPTGPFSAGATMIMLTCTDSDGASDSCVSTVTVVAPPPANIIPTAICRDITISATNDCTASVTPDMIDGGSIDPEDDSAGVPLIKTMVPMTPLSVGTTTVTLTVTDSELSSSSCEASVTVIDDETPTVNCGTVGVIAPCQEPVTMNFGAETKANGCPVTVRATLQRCPFCDDAGNVQNGECVVTVGDIAVIEETGGIGTHIEFAVTATNDNGSLSATKTCTICTQKKSKTFDPGCSSKSKSTGSSKSKTARSSFTCSAGFPDASFPKCIPKTKAPTKMPTKRPTKAKSPTKAPTKAPPAKKAPPARKAPK